MTYKIDTISKTEFPEVVVVWEASVRATHHFLDEKDIQYFKPLILNEYLNAVQLGCIRNTDKEIIGFMGVADRQLEMLFIHPEYRGMGVGKSLLTYSIHELNVNKVDVNEQNEQAVEFYKHCGFEIISRSELDASGKPYPILHMELKR
ncbi:MULTISPECIES: GNAT family N-acetyltransferase [Arenibacter]|uniref:GNAT family N-acetyltransferase n=1 Tax=Arenibacter TaxID=178469 RepID=UPI0004DF00AC|nr:MULTISPECIES: GNAT family N-acetyltransferase [Arenibacter]GBF20793.1 putative N-acetyltransferase YjaB [Arenibacter sp. NBRC 103722]